MKKVTVEKPLAPVKKAPAKKVVKKTPVVQMVPKTKTPEAVSPILPVTIEHTQEHKEEVIGRFFMFKTVEERLKHITVTELQDDNVLLHLEDLHMFLPANDWENILRYGIDPQELIEDTTDVDDILFIPRLDV